MDTGTHSQSPPSNEALALAVAKAGGQTALAKAIGRRQASVWEWLNVSGKVSAEDAIAIERVTGVPAERINAALGEYARMRGLRMRRAA